MACAGQNHFYKRPMEWLKKVKRKKNSIKKRHLACFTIRYSLHIFTTTSNWFELCEAEIYINILISFSHRLHNRINVRLMMFNALVFIFYFFVILPSFDFERNFEIKSTSHDNHNTVYVRSQRLMRDLSFRFDLVAVLHRISFPVWWSAKLKPEIMAMCSYSATNKLWFNSQIGTSSVD